MQLLVLDLINLSHQRTSYFANCTLNITVSDSLSENLEFGSKYNFVFALTFTPFAPIPQLSPPPLSPP